MMKKQMIYLNILNHYHTIRVLWRFTIHHTAMNREEFSNCLLTNTIYYICGFDFHGDGSKKLGKYLMKF